MENTINKGFFNKRIDVNLNIYCLVILPFQDNFIEINKV